MYHPLAVHIQQSPGNSFELPGTISSVTNGVNCGKKTHKLEPIRIPMCPDELVDIPIGHPFRDHRKQFFPHCHSQQWEHIWMAKALPRHDFLAERLRDRNDHQLFDTHFWQTLGGDPHL